MKLRDLKAHFTQVLPLATGVYTGIYYVCPNDPRGKRAHGVLFDPPINPYGADAEAQIGQALDANASWRAQPKWTRRGGESVDTLTLTPSITQPCCHIVITNGEVTP